MSPLRPFLYSFEKCVVDLLVRNPSASLSPTLNKNEKVKQYIRKKDP